MCRNLVLRSREIIVWRIRSAVPHRERAALDFYHLECHISDCKYFRLGIRSINFLTVYLRSFNRSQNGIRQHIFRQLRKPETDLGPLGVAIHLHSFQNGADNLAILIGRSFRIDGQFHRLEIFITRGSLRHSVVAVKAPFGDRGEVLAVLNPLGIFPLSLGRNDEYLAGGFVQLAQELHDIDPGHHIDRSVRILHGTRVAAHNRRPQSL